MRKKVLFTVLLVFFISAFNNKVVANPVTRQQAQKNVKAFLSKKGKKMEPAIADAEASKGEDSASYYIFNVGDNGGYVIASGDDCVPAILGYSDNGSIIQEAMPDNMKAWLEEYENQIAYMREHGLTSSGMLTTTHAPISPLLTTTWGQGDPYNQSCPDFFTYGKCVTGCVATAMAQVMYYHRKKSVRQTTAEIPAYQCSTNWNGLGRVSVEAIPSGSVIDWDNMLDGYSGSSTAIQQKAVANLMAYCGASVKMNYKNALNGGSGAYSEDVPEALKKYFDYNEKVTLEKRANYSDDEWDNLIYSELSKGNPIFYSGSNSSAGHAFVCDGYDGDGYYHINWGWTGTSDGNFLLSVLDPKEQGIGGSSSGYNLNQTALIGAIPNGEIIILTTQDLTISGNTSFLVSLGDKITLSLKVTLKNLTGETHSFSNAIGLFNKGSLTEVITELSNINSLSSGGETTQNVSLSVRTNLTSGVYQIIPISKEVGEEKWNKNGNSTEKYITLVIKDGVMSFYVGKPSVTTEVISFADSEVKRICVENWDTDGDGEISYDEAAAVLSLGTVFNKSSIKTFDEAQYFTAIKEFGLCDWFGNCSSLTSIQLPSSVTTIKDAAFYGCSALETISIPSSVKTIGEAAFCDCSALHMITLPEQLTSIGVQAFLRCSSLESIEIPASVTSIGYNAFGACSNLDDFVVDGANNNYCALDGVLFTKDKKTLVQFPSKREGTYSIPLGTEILESSSFYMSKIGTVEIPSSLTKIKSQAFMYSNSLAQVDVPNTVKNLEYGVFYGCSALEKAVLPSSLTSIANTLFINCKKLEYVSLPPNLTSIGNSSFGGCWALTEIEIPSTVTSIGSQAFKNSGLKIVKCLLESPCSIESSVFAGINSNAKLYVPIGSKAAYETADNWKSFTEILEIGRDQAYAVFNNGTLTFYYDKNRESREGTTYDLNDGNNRPGWYDNRSSITKVVFDDSFASAKPVSTYYWFYLCANLTEIQGLSNLNTSNVITMYGMFYECSKLTNIDISNFIINKVTSTTYMFAYCYNLSAITLPSNLTSIGANAFSGCSSLQGINLPNVLETIGTGAFRSCRAMTSVEIPASVISIGDNAFGGCTGINDFVVNSANSNYCAVEGVIYTKDGKKLVQYPAKRRGTCAIQSNTETIGNGAFYGSNIQSVAFPSSVTALEDYAFDNCNLLEDIEIHSNITNIGIYAFAYCYNLKTITLPQSLSSISNYLLNGCSKLEKVILPEQVNSIGKSSFANCSSLTEIEIPSKVTSIGNYAFSGCSKLSTVISWMQTPCSIVNNVFNGVASDAILYVPTGCVSDYKSADNWKNFNSIEEYVDIEPYAVFSNGTLTFYNDRKRSKREGDTYSLNIGNFTPDWCEKNSLITKVIFDSSFASAMPTSTFEWFKGCSNLNEIERFEFLNTNDVTTMGSMFSGCAGLTSLDLSGLNIGKVTDMNSMFYGCSDLTNIVLPTNISRIFNSQFADCSSLSNFTIPNTVTTIDANAFSGCSSLASLTIPSSVTSIGYSAFIGCNLTSLEIHYKELNRNFISLNNNLQKLVIGAEVKSIDTSYGFLNEFNSLTSIVVESSNPKYDSRDNCNALIETSSNTLIKGCKNTVIPNTVTIIGEKAFWQCKGLSSISIPNSVTTINGMAFQGCSDVTSISIGSGVKEIFPASFSLCSKLSSITVSSDNTVYDSRDNCNAIIHTSSVGLMAGCKNTIFPENVSVIAPMAFAGCTDLISVVIPNSVTEIVDDAFAYCSNLTSVTIGGGVTSIGFHVFYNCQNLTELTCMAATVPTIKSDAFAESNIGNATLYVPKSSFESYSSAEPWSGFKEIIALPVNELSCGNLECSIGSKHVLKVSLQNEDEIKLCYFDLRLPAGVTVATISNGKLDANLTERAENHSISSSQLSNGDYRFLISSLGNDSFTGNSGTLLEITLDISAAMEIGEYVVKILNSELSVRNGSGWKVVKPADAESELIIKNYTLGDVNDDGSVSVTDVGCTINYILKKVPNVFSPAAADMNDDRSISVTDVGMIIEQILNAGVAASRQRSSQDVLNAELSLVPVADGYQLMLNNKEAFVSFQMDIQLANGATINGLKQNDDNHRLTFNKLDDGNYRVVCYSLSNSTFQGDAASLLNISTTGDIIINDIRLTTARFNELRPMALSGTSTGISNVEHGMQVSVQGNTLQIVSDSETTINLYSLGGSICRVLNLHRGVNSIDGLRSGVYMIGNRKVIIR